jgi:hypothetical protein
MIDETRVVPNPELIGPALDLGRPELHEVLERYIHEPEACAAPIALIVEGDGAREPEVARALAADGWEIKRCSGPVGTNCPILSGRDCPVRNAADVAVVFADPRDMTEGTSLTPRLRCAGDPSSPAVLVLMGRLDPPRIRGRNAVVGSMRDPSLIVGTIEELQARV